MKLRAVATEELTALQVNAVSALVEGNSVRVAAQIVGCTEMSIQRWIRSVPAFTEMVEAGKAQAVTYASNRLSSAAFSAVVVLEAVMNDVGANPSVRVKAADSLLNNTLRMSELIDMRNRLAALEDGAHVS
jgi:hypothetical protein